MFWKNLRNGMRGAGLLALFLLTVLVVQAQQSVVYGIFFYSPTCPHCHKVINDHWPSIQAEFGDQLQVLFIDVSVRQGSQYMGIAIETMDIPTDGVPMLIIGSEVLVGSIDIPQRAPEVIRSGLEGGGIGFPPIPGIAALFEMTQGSDAVISVESIGTESPIPDPANTYAVGILIGLILTLSFVAAAGWSAFSRHSVRLLARMNGDAGRWAVLLAAVAGIGLAASVVFGSLNDAFVPLLAASVLLIFIVLAVQSLRAQALQRLPNWSIPLVTVAGLIVAGYLAYVEVSLTEAVCGVVGDCNTVQQSSYARIAGIPVGVLGIVGYLVVLGLWVVKQVQHSRWIDTALFAGAFLGVGFSAYLTFLEPFVIGASCVWCLTSALLMLILLWLTAPAGWDALRSIQRSVP